MFKYYNMNQLVLPLDLEIKLQENDIAFHIHHLVESIPDEAFQPFLRNTGCPAYHPRMMLKIILCAYSQSVFSGRKIEALLKDSIRMMWLAQGYEPSYRTINRFRVHPEVKELIRQCFVQFRCQLVEEKLIDQEAIFIDGTKIEANANKFTFVWKKSIEKYNQSLIEKSNQLYNELLEKEIIPEMERENEGELSVEELAQMVQQVDEVITEYDQKIEASPDATERKALRSERKYPKRVYKQLIDLILRKQKYQKDFEILGERNSYSKTDLDATFMRMKDDYMKNGQLKAGYNVQIATEGQYALAYSIFPNPTDTRTLIPFLNEIEKHYFPLPKYIVADAGYGSEQNYEDILSNRKCEALIPYTMYEKEQKKKYKQNPFHPDNWTYDEESDTYTCPNQQRVTFRYRSVRTDKTGFKRELKIYECENCSGCPFRSSCTKAKEGNHRKVMVNEKWERQKEYVRAKLSEEKAGSIFRQRKMDVEPVFGFLKANLRFTRFSVRGKSKVENEMGIALMAVNLRKYTANKDQLTKNNGEKWKKENLSWLKFSFFLF
ncbi:IS1182 family transposase [Ureibacillus sp. FSL W7-1570]|uniref:IS1182 family transposase n=1 Tax=Ureibacillus sp. FSL W7-1570 TaxID=2954593 RepID=UPI00315B338D